MHISIFYSGRRTVFEGVNICREVDATRQKYFFFSAANSLFLFIYI